MAFNGSGVHNRVHDWTQDLINTIPVTASRMDAEHDDISASLSSTICRDGQSTTTARIPFASGVSAAAGSPSSVAYAQTNDANTGLYFPGADQWGLVAGGTVVATGTASGVAVTGTLGVSGAVTLASSLALTGDLAVNTNKFSVAASSGNTTIAGTLAVTGAATFSAPVTVSTGGATITGNSTVAGTLSVSSTLTASNGFTVSGGAVSLPAGALETQDYADGSVTLAKLAPTAKAFEAQLLHAREEQPIGFGGGTFTAGAWLTRVLNTVKTNEIAGASVVSNQITLPAGSYWIDARAPGHDVGEHVVKLRNITDGIDVLIGSAAFCLAGDPTVLDTTDSFVKGRFTIAAPKVFELQHQCSTTSTTNGFGRAATFVINIYSEITIWKIG